MGAVKLADKPIFNRRLSRRAPTIFKVQIAESPQYAANISREGVFIVTDAIYALDDIIDFELSFPGLLGPIPLRGEVRFISGAGAPLVGVGLHLMLDAAQAARMASIADAADDAAGPTGLASDRRSAARPDLLNARSFRMLVCEDNPHAREMFVYGLRKLGAPKNADPLLIDIVESLNGQDGWRLLQDEAQTFDLVVVDMYMPVLGGEELITRIRQSSRLADVPIIAVSSSREARSLALVAGADIFLPKPVQLRDILVTVRALLFLE